jgi:amidase
MLDRWQEAKVDVVLCPAGPHTAVLPGEWNMDTYTVVWNAMDVRYLLPVMSFIILTLVLPQYPAAIIPFTKADPIIDVKDSSFAPLNSVDAKNESKCINCALPFLLV